MLVGTAGHIDHGKTALVRALTGVETDRLPEERARGISIDLGFAYWRPDDGHTIGFIDVPGHERFVRNMLSGVGGIDLALLVVAADDGVMPQSVEHIQILDLLGISNAIVAINKCDRASRDRIDVVRTQTEALLSSTAMSGAPVFEVSATSGNGIAELGDALRKVNSAMSSRYRPGRGFRLAIDRTFSVAGAGTVVTGTVISGELEIGARLRTAPNGFDVRVRGLQSGGTSVQRVVAGQRCAVNLAGIEKKQARRGHWLVTPSMSTPTSRLEVRLQVLGTRTEALKHFTPVHFHMGTADVEARVIIPRQRAIPPGGEAIVHLALEDPVCAATGDRFVVRDQTARVSIGGGQIIDAFLKQDRRSKAAREPLTAAMNTPDPTIALAALLAIPNYEVRTEHFERSFNIETAAANELYKHAGAFILGPDRGLALPSSRVELLSAEIIGLLEGFHKSSPELGGLSARELKTMLSCPISSEALAGLLRQLHERQKIASLGSIFKLPSHKPKIAPGDENLWQKLLPLLLEREAMPFTALELAKEARTDVIIISAVLRRKRALGEVWQITEERFLLREQVAALAARADVLTRQIGGSGFTAAQYRDAIGTGRTWAIQVLEFFDTHGVTRRNRDLRKSRDEYTLIFGIAEPYVPRSQDKLRPAVTREPK